MRKQFFTILVLLFAAWTYACTDPAANKPKATVGNAASESTPARTAGGETLTVSPDNSKVEFIGAKVTGSHNGGFKQFSGTVDLINNSAEQSLVKIDIDTASIFTDDEKLTAHLKTADFFDVAKYPKATFVSTKIEPNTSTGATHNITGNFDLHGVRKSITFPATIQIGADSVTVKAEFSISRKDFGINYAGKTDDLIRDGVVIKINLLVPRK